MPLRWKSPDVSPQLMMRDGKRRCALMLDPNCFLIGKLNQIRYDRNHGLSFMSLA
jgi:hypothetical protein